MKMTINLVGRKAQISIVTFLVLMIAEHTVRGQRCTDTLAGKKIQEVVKKEPCVEKFTARCGWLSLSYCTFYRGTFCERKVNETVTYYYIQTGCCAGYVMAPNKTCIKRIPGKDYSGVTVVSLDDSKVDPNYVSVKGESKPKEEEVTLSVGGYAGIICGFGFLCVVVVFIVKAVRKRQRRMSPKKSQSPSHSLHIEQAEQMQALHSPKTDTGARLAHSIPTAAEAKSQREKLVPSDPDRTTDV